MRVTLADIRETPYWISDAPGLKRNARRSMWRACLRVTSVKLVEIRVWAEAAQAQRPRWK
jgi:hypothetical protein